MNIREFDFQWKHHKYDAFGFPRCKKLRYLRCLFAPRVETKLWKHHLFDDVWPLRDWEESCGCNNNSSSSNNNNKKNDNDNDNDNDNNNNNNHNNNHNHNHNHNNNNHNHNHNHNNNNKTTITEQAGDFLGNNSNPWGITGVRSPPISICFR